MFSDHNGILFEINNRKIIGYFPNSGELNYTFLNNPWVKGEVSKEI